MVTIDAPLIGFLALAVVPVVWWLHRRQGQATIAVAALFLWRTASAAAPVDAARRTDPLWMLRAAVCVALMLALAGTGWRSAPPVTVWLDDAFSMLAQESDGTRARIAMRRVFELAGNDFALRLLRDPAAVPPADGGAEALADWLEAYLPGIRGTAITPRLDPGREHWLVTDGAGATARRLMTTGRFHRHVLVGEASENVAVTGLALRRALRQQERHPTLVRVANLGREPARRTLIVHGDGAPLLERDLYLQPAQEQTVWLEVPVAISHLRAALAEADALPADDSFDAALGTLARPAVRVAGACPARLVRALEHHPGIRVQAEGAQPSLVVSCGSQLEAPAGTAIRVHQGMRYAPTSSLLVWKPGMLGSSRYFRHSLHALHEVTRDPGAEAVLQDAETGLALITAGPAGVDVYVDLGSGVLANAADYLTLVEGMLTAAIGRPALDPLHELSRPAAASHITPSGIARDVAASGVSPGASRDLSNLLIMLAILLLAVDVLTAHARRDQPASPAAAGG